MQSPRISILTLDPARDRSASHQRLSELVLHALPGCRVSLSSPAPGPGASLAIVVGGAFGRLRGFLKEEPRLPTMAVLDRENLAVDGLDTLLADGLDDYVFKPVDEREFLPRLRRLVSRQSVTASAALPTRRDEPRPSIGGLVGESPAFRRILELIHRLAEVDATLLVTGETGTGKELVARSIHYRSQRSAKPFVPINCGALPDNLVENELFGHARGAYTDADRDTRGLVAEAEGGTLFLDEIDALGLAGQAKLLRFLQNQEYRPLGSGRAATADVRVIAASNADLRRSVSERRFRRDLFYRLDILHMNLPPVRERPGDAALLAETFLERYRRAYGRGPRRLSAAALAALDAHPWPGNVRELESRVHRGVLLCRRDQLEAADLELCDDDRQTGARQAGGEGLPRPTLRQAKENLVAGFEKSYLIEMLEACRGNVSEAARAAGKERRSFQRLLRKHDIDRRRFAP